ncbi:DUF5615 family PIN-like protein [Candidatus Berkelbacteria bacterium]|nr:DUF5615 family PIN-like protein [Candidatus Berkelbacteria bacterium]
MSQKKHSFHFFLDENFPLSTGKFLESEGYIVTLFPDQLRNIKFPDENVIKLATKQNCILLTKDEAILNNKNLIELIQKSVGIVVLLTIDSSLKNYKRLVLKMLQVLKPNQIKGKILKVTLGKMEYIEPVR